MKKIKIILLSLISVIFLVNCKKGEINSREVENIEGYSDGTYCADIDYYNPDTGTSSSYTLNVEVENNEVTVIHWPNGGWLDSSHFSPEKLDSSGCCSFTSDKGYEYNIKIIGSEGSSTSNVIDNESDNESVDEVNTSDDEVE